MSEMWKTQKIDRGNRKMGNQVKNREDSVIYGRLGISGLVLVGSNGAAAFSAIVHAPN